MSRQSEQVLIRLSVDAGDREEVASLTDELRKEIEYMKVDAIENVSGGAPRPGDKAGELIAIGQLVVMLGPPLIVPLFGVIKAWIERRPSVPVKIRIRVGKNISEIEYDPTCTSPQQLHTLVRDLERAASGSRHALRTAHR